MWLGTVLVLAALVLLERSVVPAVGFFGGKNLADHYERLRALDAREGVEVIAIGDSLVAAGVDAERLSEALGETVYGFGLISSDLHVQSLAVEHVILPHFRPRLLLWNMESELRRQSGINHQYMASPALDRGSGLWSRLEFDLELGFPKYQRRRFLQWLGVLEQPLDERWDEHGFRDSWQSLALDLRGEKQPPRPQDLRSIAVFTQLVRSHSLRNLAERDSNEGGYAASEEEGRAAFRRALVLAREHDVRVLAWAAPWWSGKFEPESEYARALASGKFDAHHAWVQAVLAEFEIPLLNLRYLESVSDDAGCFADETHMNHVGAERLVPVLADYLSGRMGEIPEPLRGLPSPAERAAIEARR